MGRKSTGATIACIMLSFLRQRTWSQVDLARACGISVKALRPRLLELQAAGMPFDIDADPPHVYWSVGRRWFPEARILEQRQVALVARLLERLPPSAQRSQALRALLDVRDRPEPSDDSRRDEMLDRLEDAARERKVARVDYYTVSRGDRGVRDVSVHRVLHEDRVRVLATCHRSNTLKYFRLDEMHHVHLVQGAFRSATDQDVTAFLAASVGGYRSPDEAIHATFFVRHPDARWVVRNLPKATIDAEHTNDGIRFTAHTAGLEQLARFVVGLGAAARVETPALEQRVQQLALGALKTLRPPRKLNGRSVGVIRATR